MHANGLGKVFPELTYGGKLLRGIGNFPRIVRRHIRISRLCWICLYVTWLSALTILVLYLSDCRSGLAGTLASFYPQALIFNSLVPSVLIIIYLSLRYRAAKILRNAKSADITVCLNCGYDLWNLPEEHVCPECGVKYQSKDIQNTWRSKDWKRGSW